jgi:hypothetical protein
LGNDKVQVQASDRGTVLVVRQPNVPFNATPYATNKFVCVTGVVQNDLSVRESTVEGFGNDFNLDNFNAVVKAKHVFPNVFY